MAVAGVGAGAEITGMDIGGAGAENKYYRLRNIARFTCLDPDPQQSF